MSLRSGASWFAPPLAAPHTGQLTLWLRSILANEKNNAKFNFLMPGDPYHAYYEQKASGGLVAKTFLRLTRTHRSPPSARKTAKRNRRKCAAAWLRGSP
jgi:hypothetical protein